MRSTFFALAVLLAVVDSKKEMKKCTRFARARGECTPEQLKDTPIKGAKAQRVVHAKAIKVNAAVKANSMDSTMMIGSPAVTATITVTTTEFATITITANSADSTSGYIGSDSTYSTGADYSYDDGSSGEYAAATIDSRDDGTGIDSTGDNLDDSTYPSIDDNSNGDLALRGMGVDGGDDQIDSNYDDSNYDDSNMDDSNMDDSNMDYSDTMDNMDDSDNMENTPDDGEDTANANTMDFTGSATSEISPSSIKGQTYSLDAITSTSKSYATLPTSKSTKVSIISQSYQSLGMASATILPFPASIVSVPGKLRATMAPYVSSGGSTLQIGDDCYYPGKLCPSNAICNGGTCTLVCPLATLHPYCDDNTPCDPNYGYQCSPNNTCLPVNAQIVGEGEMCDQGFENTLFCATMETACLDGVCTKCTLH